MRPALLFGCEARRIALAGIVGMALALGVATAGAQDDVQAVSGAVPALVSIPKIGTRAAVVPLGLLDDGTLDAPSDPDTVGWFMLGPGVGAPGNAILDGHVDWGGRLRVFGLLKNLQAGDPVQVTDVNGQTLSYTVTWTRLVDADDAPLDEIYEQSPTEEITLITCGGEFDRSIRMYLSRVVVRAVRDPSGG
jgi:LPXTG-site transpeptidase (sortase) family protein